MAENLGNDWSSTLNGAINNSTTSVVVTSATGAPSANFRIRVDDELMLVTAVATNTFTVTRGVEGTTAASHSDGASVSHVLTKTGLLNYITENAPQAASQSDQESASSTTTYVSPGRQKYHPSAVKVWALIAGNGASIGASYNVSSVTDVTTGAVNVNLSVNMSSANWAGVASLPNSTINLQAAVSQNSTTYCEITSYEYNTTTLGDPGQYNFIGCGDQ